MQKQVQPLAPQMYHQMSKWASRIPINKLAITILVTSLRPIWRSKLVNQHRRVLMQLIAIRIQLICLAWNFLMHLSEFCPKFVATALRTVTTINSSPKPLLMVIVSTIMIEVLFLRDVIKSVMKINWQTQLIQLSKTMSKKSIRSTFMQVNIILIVKKQS